MAALLTHTPSTLTAGDSVRWTISLPDFPAPAWMLSYYLVKDGSQIVITGSQYGAGDDHYIAVAKATTANWPAGTYKLSGGCG